MLDYATNPLVEFNEQGQLTRLIESLKLQYNGGQYVYTKYIPDLVTKLNFNNTMSYSGNIDGFDNMKINVNGNLVYGGAENVEGSTAAATDILPDETVTILTANSVTGNLKNSSTYAQISGMLSATGKIENNQISVTARAENNIGVLNSEQSQAFNAVNNMATSFKNDEKKSEILPLYYLESENAGAALSQIGNYDAAQNISVIQQNSVANKVISDRLTTSFSMDTVNFDVSPNNFADGDNGVVMGVNADYPASVDNNFWIKFTKNWGELKGGDLAWQKGSHDKDLSASIILRKVW